MSRPVAEIGNSRFAFLGGGNMAEALIRGLLTGLDVSPRHIVATDIVRERCDHLRATYGITTSEDNPRAVQDSQVVFLAVKPQTVPRLVGLRRADSRSGQTHCLHRRRRPTIHSAECLG